MLQIRKSTDRGHVDFGWLQSKHTFSFGNYFDRKHMGFRSLRVINEDVVRPRAGFGEHHHENMEIISYVLSGSLAHKDSMGNGSVVKAGEFQRMTAGTGVDHSEMNPSNDTPVHFLQIWIEPDQRGLKPSYQEFRLNSELEPNQLHLVASNDTNQEALLIHQDASLSLANLMANETMEISLGENRYGWLQMVRGSLNINSMALKAGDGVAIQPATGLKLEGLDDAEFLFFDLA